MSSKPKTAKKADPAKTRKAAAKVASEIAKHVEGLEAAEAADPAAKPTKIGKMKPQRAKAIAAADQANAAADEQRAKSPDGMLPSERAMTKAAPTPTLAIDGTPLRVIALDLAKGESEKYGLSDDPVVWAGSLAELTGEIAGHAKAWCEAGQHPYRSQFHGRSGLLVIDDEELTMGGSRYVLVYRTQTSRPANKPKRTPEQIAADKAARAAERDAARKAKADADELARRDAEIKADAGASGFASAFAAAMSDPNLPAFATIKQLHRWGVIKGDGSIDESRIRLASGRGSGSGNRRGAKPVGHIFGSPCTAALRWCGANGLTNEQAERVIAHFNCSPSPSTFRGCLQSGRNGVTRYGPLPEFTAEQAAEIRKVAG